MRKLATSILVIVAALTLAACSPTPPEAKKIIPESLSKIKDLETVELSMTDNGAETIAQIDNRNGIVRVINGNDETIETRDEIYTKSSAGKTTEETSWVKTEKLESQKGDTTGMSLLDQLASMAGGANGSKFEDRMANAKSEYQKIDGVGVFVYSFPDDPNTTENDEAYFEITSDNHYLYKMGSEDMEIKMDKINKDFDIKLPENIVSF